MAVTILEWGQSVCRLCPALLVCFCLLLVRLADDDNRVRFGRPVKKKKRKENKRAVEGDGIMKCFPESPEFVNNRVATLTLVVCYQFFGVGNWRER